MANVLVNDEYLSDIADSIRAKNGSSDTYTPAEMSTAIDNIPTGGTEPDPTDVYVVRIPHLTLNNTDVDYVFFENRNTVNKRIHLKGPAIYLPGYNDLSAGSLSAPFNIKPDAPLTKRKCPIIIRFSTYGDNTAPSDDGGTSYAYSEGGFLWGNNDITDYYFSIDSHNYTQHQEASYTVPGKALLGSGLFAYNTSLERIHIVDTPAVPAYVFGTGYMFYNCESLETLTWGDYFRTANWHTNPLGDVQRYNLNCMFYGCKSLTYLDLQALDTSSDPDATFVGCTNAFFNCTALEFLDVRNIEFSKFHALGSSKYRYCFGSYSGGRVRGFNANCNIIVKDATEKSTVQTMNAGLTHVYTVQEAIAAGIITS